MIGKMRERGRAVRYQKVVKGRFIARPNRFIAHVETEGRVEVCHVKNTGRCRELLRPGAAVYLAAAENPARKTRWDLVAVKKGDLLINMDAQAPNRVFREWAEAGRFLPGLTVIRPEYTWEDSRFDFLLEDSRGPMLVEVKGVTLEEDGAARFPDAPTERGVKHLRELQRAAEAGLGAALVFVVQMEGMRHVEPNDRTHLAFGEALRAAAAQGVRVCAVECAVTPGSLGIRGEVPVVM